MRIYIICIICIVFTSRSFAQQKVQGIWAEIKSDRTVMLFTEYNPKYCLNLSSTSVESEDRLFFVIGDSICPNSHYATSGDRNFVIFHQGKKYLIRKSDVENRTEVDSQIVLFRSKGVLGDLATYGADTLKLRLAKKARIQADNARLEKSLEFARANGFVISSWDWSYGSEYSSFIDLDINIFNPFKARVKYVWITFKAWNPVDDPAIDLSTGSSQKTVRGIGPIEYQSVGSYTFDNVFYSKVVDRIRITQVKFQFFDGSIKVFNKPGVISGD